MDENSPPIAVAALFDRLVEESLPGQRGEKAWRALLQAHATLMRQLDTELREKTGLRLADFDVLAQLAGAGGELRMTDLAARTLISRSGLTRRVARLVDEGLVRRANVAGDGRGVVVALTDAGLARLAETVPVHLRGVSKLFVERLDDQELAVLETALEESPSTARSAEDSARGKDGKQKTGRARLMRVDLSLLTLQETGGAEHLVRPAALPRSNDPNLR